MHQIRSIRIKISRNLKRSKFKSKMWHLKIILAHWSSSHPHSWYQPNISKHRSSIIKGPNNISNQVLRPKAVKSRVLQAISKLSFWTKLAILLKFLHCSTLLLFNSSNPLSLQCLTSVHCSWKIVFQATTCRWYRTLNFQTKSRSTQANISNLRNGMEC